MPGSFPTETDTTQIEVTANGAQRPYKALSPACFMPPPPEPADDVVPSASSASCSRRSSAMSIIEENPVKSTDQSPSAVEKGKGRATEAPESTRTATNVEKSKAPGKNAPVSIRNVTNENTLMEPRQDSLYAPRPAEGSRQGAAREAAERGLWGQFGPENFDAALEVEKKIDTVREVKEKTSVKFTKYVDELVAKYPKIYEYWPESYDENEDSSKAIVEYDAHGKPIDPPIRARKIPYLRPSRWTSYPFPEEDQVKLRALHYLHVPQNEKGLSCYFDASLDRAEMEKKRDDVCFEAALRKEDADMEQDTFWRSFRDWDTFKFDAIRHALEEKEKQTHPTEKVRYTDARGRRFDRFTCDEAAETENDYDKLISKVLDAKSVHDLQFSSAGKARLTLMQQAYDRRYRAEEQARARYVTEQRLKKAGGLRLPFLSVVQALPDEWVERAQDIMRRDSEYIVTTTRDGTELKRHDLARLVPHNEWLNDEIINATLEWLDVAINKAAGIVDFKKQTRKCLALSSFFFSRISSDRKGTDRILRRYGIDKENFYKLDTVLIPVCEFSHWTLLVLRPSRFEFEHIDSLRPDPAQRYRIVVQEWLHEFLGDGHKYAFWTRKRYQTPAQINGHDCGMHVITNAICLALGVSPIDAYLASDLPMMRLRIACVLLERGFNGLFSLDGI